MEVIKNGNTVNQSKNKKYKCKCRICGCIFAFTAKDLIVENQKSIISYTEKSVVKCPQCNLSINMDNPYYNNIKSYTWFDGLKSVFRKIIITIKDSLK